MTDTNQDTSFEQVITELLDESKPFPPKLLRAFSDIESDSLQLLKQSWQDVPVLRKVTLLQDLEDLMEVDTLISCDAFAKFAMRDIYPEVRSQAIQLLWECEDTSLILTLLGLLEQDPDEGVRAAAAAALGKFVLLGELEEISKSKSNPIVTKLLEVVQREPAGIIQRKALESLGYSSNASIPQLIKKALERDDAAWTASALFAMGRSLDEHWGKIVLEHLSDPELLIKSEAIRAAGELELTSSLPTLFEILDDEDIDNDLRFQVYWALSKIGGKGVRQKLEEEMSLHDDEDILDVLDLALENLDFTEDSDDFDLFDME